MSEYLQPALFPDDEDKSAPLGDEDISEWAKKVAEGARPYDPNKEPSEAAKDQGHRYVEAPPTEEDEIKEAQEKLDETEGVPTLTKKEAKLLNDKYGRRGVDPSNPRTEVPGKHGRSNWKR